MATKSLIIPDPMLDKLLSKYNGQTFTNIILRLIQEDNDAITIDGEKLDGDDKRHLAALGVQSEKIKISQRKLIEEMSGMEMGFDDLKSELKLLFKTLEDDIDNRMIALETKLR